VRLEVRNTPPTRPVDAGLIGTGSGMGLANLRRRVELVQGTLHAGPVAGGGFGVEATLPAYVPTIASARG
jgi:signal transduction histidine kinase